ncbi:MAG: ADP-glyceromanno-heptose 6-epimerase [Sphingobacteriales bacterium]|jgi:ADP-L-glycero-D-manno-heptose 6-epimerase|nr:ADP-glyceromanno-heptose 6-epimerase [Sphingobacteriales bacterium]MBP9141142.1 ADP-glyceromanno-heptose 6-epimerase [Chitinophagales bacterium]MDA0198315.1 ADP-glyceromanno-heptose 6-epimerase [Bacteroidota bacterium]MBK6889535.1 ADP-glyceromanno-heptose 6-epimerase [Sphingobacteriales bacterium]MBK7527961.1 ADP-glyceromanno-heptose 6-epimerase [Sphingobacteriales bacterium]
MIVITGAAGFIGSCAAAFFNQLGRNDLILVDEFASPEKKKNLTHKKYLGWMQRDGFVSWFLHHPDNVEAVYHFGARSSTTEWDTTIFDRLNVNYSKSLWEICTQNQIPFLYASSAATYGDGNLGYADNHQIPFELKPLNPYGISKNEFDKWALQQTTAPPYWYGMKFFNVYGPNEYHKGRNASVVMHGFNQITQAKNGNGFIKLFKSHKEGFANGGQLRDFVYVKDIIKVCHWLLHVKRPNSGLYNLGTGQARSFEDLAKAVFAALNLPPKIEYIDMPEDIRDKYQYYTQAEMQKLQQAGYNQTFATLENGVADYVQNYLAKGLYW